MKVCVIGLGYIGFPTACVIAQAGHNVVGVDSNPEVVADLIAGAVRIVNESGLEDFAREVFSSGRFRVTQHPETADVFIIAVPTPVQGPGLTRHGSELGNGVLAQVLPEAAATGVPCAQYRADLSCVVEAARGIAPIVKEGDLVVLESTVPVGTTGGLVSTILDGEGRCLCGRGVYLAYAPERVLPGKILKELTLNDRCVGGIDAASTQKAANFYRTFVKGNVVATDAATAELVKLMENTFRDVNIALANEFALVAERLGVDVFEAIAVANRHPRVSILRPGPGVGGHCIAADPYFVVESAPDETRLIASARQVNSSMPRHVCRLLEGIVRDAAHTDGRVERIAVLGLTYKANVADTRESPALEIVRLMREAGYSLEVHDPYIREYQCRTVQQTLKGADLLVLLTDHDTYRQELAPVIVSPLMRRRLILDTRGFFGPDWDESGFRVTRLGVGRPCDAVQPAEWFSAKAG